MELLVLEIGLQERYDITGGFDILKIALLSLFKVDQNEYPLLALRVRTIIA